MDQGQMRCAAIFGRFSKVLGVTALGALVVGPLASAAEAQNAANRRRPPVIAPRPIPPMPPITPDGPVRCNIDRMREDGGYLSTVAIAGQNRTHRPRVMPSPSVAPPPPPPPPPIMASPVADASIVTTGNRIAPPGYPRPQPPVNTDRERYKGKDVSTVKAVAEEPVSTFSVDVDTGSYANVRRFLNRGELPPAAAVRTEEMLNYFRYDYATPKDRSVPFSVTTDMANSPWNAQAKLLRIGINGYDIPKAERPRTNLVFLVDVSGSMNSEDKLPLVRNALSQLADQLTAKDKVSIVVYAGAAGIVLEPTSNAAYVKQALSCLEAGGSTAGGQGMELAYATARKHFVKGGVNRVIMATDGDFNVGISSDDGIEAIVKKNRETGITLTTLGFGQGNYNEAMMERVADIGNGSYAYIDGLSEARKVLADEMAGTIFTIAKDVKIQIEFNPSAVKEYRLIGYENRILNEQDFDNDAVDAGDIGSGHQVTALYEIIPAGTTGWLPDRRYAGNKAVGKPGPANELAWLKLRYKLPDGDTSRLIERAVPVSLMRNAGSPQGDMAFALAVASYGQKLRGDTTLGDIGWRRVAQLAGSPWEPTRKEFLDLVTKAAQLSPVPSPVPANPDPELTPVPPSYALVCGIEKVRSYVGKRADPKTRAVVERISGAERVRWIEPGGVVTMDHRPHRLNAEMSGQGVITKFSCG